MDSNLVEYEKRVLEQVKFINFFLEECRKRNKELLDVFGMSYGKFIGVGTIYEDAIHSLRKVKKELDEFLLIVRENLRSEYESQSRLNRFRK